MVSRAQSLKDDVRRILIDCAKERRTITYGELGSLTGRQARGPWKTVLDEIGFEEKRSGRPDIAFLVVRKDTKIPGSIDFQRAVPPTAAQLATAKQRFQDIFDHYDNT
ncbi:hypothetical protein [Microbaculum marinum]|uniref:Winged helix-turn-helix domain-containing protein n=1 Tax=Microbaculum marinum TaxID=1764581 RepID=A0AAW9RRU9_9HYPH